MGLRRMPQLLAAVVVLVSALGVSADSAPAADKKIYGYWKSLDKDSGKTRAYAQLTYFIK